jgi:hypothetical protein
MGIKIQNLKFRKLENIYLYILYELYFSNIKLINSKLFIDRLGIMGYYL